LAFGLRHVYPIKDDLKHVHSVLKGCDALVYQSVRALGYEPVLYMYYKNDRFYQAEGVLIDRVVNFTRFEDFENRDLFEFLHAEGGVLVTRDRERLHGEYMDESLYATAEQVEWVTPMTTSNQKEDAFIEPGNVRLCIRRRMSGRTHWEGGRQVGVSKSCRSEQKTRMKATSTRYCRFDDDPTGCTVQGCHVMTRSVVRYSFKINLVLDCN